MSNEVKYVGTKWQKCDFHLHTMQSKCFSDKSVTPTQWVEEAINKGLSCIAITDHNDYRGIDSIIEAAHNTDLTIFPGVEVTCDTSKIHLLIIFDPSKTSETVRDFLSKLDIDSENIDTTEGTSKSIFDVCELAKEKGALVIAAHIDEYNGLSKVSDANIKKLIKNHYFDAVQVVNSSIWQECSKGSDEEKQMLTEKYGKPVSENDAVEWRKCFNKFVGSSIPLLCFSDNPVSKGNSKHGLWGIGIHYSWLKMDDKPTLESVRQTLLSSELRVKTECDSINTPESMPNFWIKQVKFLNTTINPRKEVTVDFNPHLNTIIGGRGSGKSTIIRLITGILYPQSVEGTAVQDDQERFYKKYDSKKGDGIFKSDSSVILTLIRSGSEYHIKVSDIKDAKEQKIEIYEVVDGEEQECNNKEILSIFKPKIFTQKQIYETARSEISLMELIDSEIDTLPQLQAKKEELITTMISMLISIKSLNATIHREQEIRIKLNDVEKRIELLNSSHIFELIKKRDSDISAIGAFKRLKSISEEICTNCKKAIDNADESMALETIAANGDAEINQLLMEYLDKSQKLLSKIKSDLDEYVGLGAKLHDDLKKTSWYKNYEQEVKEIGENSDSLAQAGINPSKFKELLNERTELNKQLEEIEKKKIDLDRLCKKYKEIESQFKNIILSISNERQKYAASILKPNDNVRIVITPFMSEISFRDFLKKTLNKNTHSINEDLDTICSKIFVSSASSEKTEQLLEWFRNLIVHMRNGERDKSLSSDFFKAIQNLDDNDFYKLCIILPDDRIELQYKPEGARSHYQPLSTASAGQKAAAIITVILSQSDSPVLLDQPEDDLDNRLVYELVVQRMKLCKEQRQIIVVTHNANIPVNGDAEYIVSMDSQTLNVNVRNSGTIDNPIIRKEICDVMEGTEYAFEMRAKKYHLSFQ